MYSVAESHWGSASWEVEMMWGGRKPEHREQPAFLFLLGTYHSRGLGQTVQTRVVPLFPSGGAFWSHRLPGSCVQWVSGLACVGCLSVVWLAPEYWWVWDELVGHACFWMVCFLGPTVLVPVVHFSPRLLTRGESGSAYSVWICICRGHILNLF